MRDLDSMYTITIWSDVASVQAWESSPEYTGVFLAAVKPFIEGSQSVSICEVVASQFAGLCDSYDRK
jgi:heme-degrading monooxygenase HmoA